MSEVRLCFSLVTLFLLDFWGIRLNEKHKSNLPECNETPLYLDSSFIYGLGSIMALNYTLWIQTSINLEEA